MYNTASRESLNEKVGYEQFVLRECSLTMTRYRGSDSSKRVTIVYPDGTKTVQLPLGDVTGVELSVALLNNLSALLFVACYKTLDMIFEWIIEENGELLDRPSFLCKIKTLEKQLSNYHLPPELVGEPQVVDALFALYQNLRHTRNVITHAGWGRVSNGDLIFADGSCVTFDELIAFSDAMSLLAELLTAPTHAPEKMTTVKIDLDVLHQHHKIPKFNISARPFGRMKYRVNVPVGTTPIVDLEKVRAADPAVHFSLIVEVETDGHVVSVKQPPPCLALRWVGAVAAVT